MTTEHPNQHPDGTPKLPKDMAEALRQDTHGIRSPDALDQAVLAQARRHLARQKGRKRRHWHWAMAAGVGALAMLLIPRLDHEVIPTSSLPEASAPIEAESMSESLADAAPETFASEPEVISEAERVVPRPPSNNALSFRAPQAQRKLTQAKRPPQPGMRPPLEEDPRARGGNAEAQALQPKTSDNLEPGQWPSEALCRHLTLPQALAIQRDWLEQLARQGLQGDAAQDATPSTTTALSGAQQQWLVDERKRLNRLEALWLALPPTQQQAPWQPNWWLGLPGADRGTLAPKAPPAPWKRACVSESPGTIPPEIPPAG